MFSLLSMVNQLILLLYKYYHNMHTVTNGLRHGDPFAALLETMLNRQRSDTSDRGNGDRIKLINKYQA